MCPVRNRKIKIQLAALMVIILSGLSISSITAYFVAAGGIDNNAKPGNSEISIEEDFENPDIEPGEETIITKKVTVSNNGINCSAVRVRVEFSNSDIERQVSGDTSKWAIVDYNTDHWTKSGEYWYYNEPLEPEDETEPLFSRITCDHPTNSQVSDFDVYVYAESRNCDTDTTLSGIKALFS